LISSYLPNLHFPLITMFDYLGQRLFVCTVLPVDHSTLVYGYCDPCLRLSLGVGCFAQQQRVQLG
jgi:hypothetical protein